MKATSRDPTPPNQPFGRRPQPEGRGREESACAESSQSSFAQEREQRTEAQRTEKQRHKRRRQLTDYYIHLTIPHGDCRIVRHFDTTHLFTISSSFSSSTTRPSVFILATLCLSQPRITIDQTTLHTVQTTPVSQPSRNHSVACSFAPLPSPSFHPSPTSPSDAAAPSNRTFHCLP